MEKFEAWKEEIIQKWLKPHRWEELTYHFAESKTEDFLKMVQEKEQAEDLKWLQERGIVKTWKHEDKTGILRGFRGEEWVRSMIEDFGVSVYQPRLEEQEIYDLVVHLLGTLEVKTSKVGYDFIGIKSTFVKRPSIYVIGLKTCDEDLSTFQFMGWLYGHEVYKLKLNRKMPYEPCFTPSFEELHKPTDFFKELIEISKYNPHKRTQ
jgi:hypothetical protein